MQVAAPFAGTAQAIAVQDPQWSGLVARLKHEPEQKVVGEAQVLAHLPAVHTVPAPQTMPQAPQFVLVVTSVSQPAADVQSP